MEVVASGGGNASGKALLRVDEAAEVLGLSRATIFRLVMRGTLPSIKIGRNRRISVQSLHRWIGGLIEEAA